MTRATIRRCSCCLIFASTLTLLACGAVQSTRKELPKESYERPAQEPHSKSDYAFKLSQMPSFYDVPGEFGHYLEGRDYGFRELSFILTETYPCGGPPLHKHNTEEAHVLLDGKASYVIGDKRFVVEGPYIARVPTGVAHTFMNIGDKEFRLMAVFPDEKLTYQKVGENPLAEGCKHELALCVSKEVRQFQGQARAFVQQHRQLRCVVPSGSPRCGVLRERAGINELQFRSRAISQPSAPSAPSPRSPTSRLPWALRVSVSSASMAHAVSPASVARSGRSHNKQFQPTRRFAARG